jgi:hypothetical protein
MNQASNMCRKIGPLVGAGDLKPQFDAIRLAHTEFPLGPLLDTGKRRAWAKATTFTATGVVHRDSDMLATGADDPK